MRFPIKTANSGLRHLTSLSFETRSIQNNNSGYRKIKIAVIIKVDQLGIKLYRLYANAINRGTKKYVSGINNRNSIMFIVAFF